MPQLIFALVDFRTAKPYYHQLSIINIFPILSVKVTVIFIPDLHCGNHVRDTLVYKIACYGKLFLQNILLGGNLHFFLKQMAKRGHGA